ncbi:UbiA family prenyltransferase [Catalinimonas sp. 4WD22]|uniref:UbiA family prenyltransferase n=1 Tax=Catalinimonas locisalis TaxID=3133978 RepID=UPI0031010B5E
MISKSTLLHLRIPFSIFLLPIFLFALSVDVPEDWPRALLVFFILHFLLYPASNGYNSYFDKDEGSIGGLEKPPPVDKELYWVALLLDLLAIILGLLISWQFALMLLIYGLVSKAYSHPAIRLKKFAIASWFIAGFFQGCFTWLMAYMGIHDVSIREVWSLPYVLPALLSSLMLWGSYPMTQIYQHEEDARRGDITLSYKLGIRGTFHFTAFVFALSAVGFFWYYQHFFSLSHALAYLAFLCPIVLYFFYWYGQVRQNRDKANFSSTMRLNMISGLSLNVFFLLMLYWHI